MPRNPKQPTAKTVEALRHKEATRRNIPTAEYQPVLEKEAQDPVRVAYERRNRDLDLQLVWRGKDEKDWSDLVVHAPSLYIQEKVHPKALISRIQSPPSVHEVAAVSTGVFETHCASSIPIRQVASLPSRSMYSCDREGRSSTFVAPRSRGGHGFSLP